MSRKGQKSLEMIIGLVILLVVASVVISMFLNIFQEPEIGQDTVELQEIQQECQSKCQDWQNSEDESSLSAALDYCQSTFEHDFNGDGTTSDVAGNGFNSYCEDGVHCFNVHTCDAGYDTLDYQLCRQLQCEYYTKINNDAFDPQAQQNVHEHIGTIYQQNVGSCDLANLQDQAGYSIATWYNQQGNEHDYYSGTQGGYVCEDEYARFTEDTATNNQVFQDACDAAGGLNPVEVNGEYCHDDPLTVQQTSGAQPIDNGQINDQNIWDDVQSQCPSGTQAISCSN